MNRVSLRKGRPMKSNIAQDVSWPIATRMASCLMHAENAVLSFLVLFLYSR